jgi:hypothetical protein
MAYPRNPFVHSVFIDVPDPSNPPPGALEVDAEEMNKIGAAVRANREGLHAAKFVLNLDEFDVYDAIDQYPVSSESSMVVHSATWPETGGVVKTFRDKASIVDGNNMSYDWQQFKAKGTGNIYIRYALMSSVATWLPNQGYVGNVLVQPATPNGHFYRSTVGGLSKNTEPTWPTTEDAEVTETDPGGTNPTVTWKEDGVFWSNWVRILTTNDLPSAIGALASSNGTFTGTLTGPNLSLTGNFTSIPTAVQAIATASDVITANGKSKLMSNTTGGAITLTSAPTIADGINGQEVTLMNTGTQNIVLQDQGTLAGSNLRLSAASITLTPLDSVKLKFFTVVGDWVQQGNVVTVV